MQHGACHGPFGLATGAGQPLHGAGDLLAGQLAFMGKAGQTPQHLQRVADGLDQLGPFDLANQTQCGDDVAHSQVGGDLRDLRLADEVQRVRAVLFGPAGQHRGRRCGVRAGQALPQLR